MPVGVYHHKCAPVTDRFWSKVDKSGECWIWTASTRGNGRPNFYFRGKCTTAHRVSWILANGEIPDGLQVLHNCPGGDNPLCVNPDHLFLGTVSDNVKDMYAKKRSWFDRCPEEARRVCSVREPQKQVRGEEVGGSKLTADKVREARRKFSEGGWTKADIAKWLGVSRTTAFRLLTRKIWRHVDG